MHGRVYDGTADVVAIARHLAVVGFAQFPSGRCLAAQLEGRLGCGLKSLLVASGRGSNLRHGCCA
jgi:hypothetical protein